MIASTMYIRIVPADRDRGYVLLAGYEPKLTQTTAMVHRTLGGLTRENLNQAIETMRASYKPSEIKDMTPAGLKNKLRKMFGEPPEAPAEEV